MLWTPRKWQSKKKKKKNIIYDFLKKKNDFFLWNLNNISPWFGRFTSLFLYLSFRLFFEEWSRILWISMRWTPPPFPLLASIPTQRPKKCNKQISFSEIWLNKSVFEFERGGGGGEVRGVKKCCPSCTLLWGYVHGQREWSESFLYLFCSLLEIFSFYSCCLRRHVWLRGKTVARRQ